MPVMTLVIAAVAAGAILLIFIGLSGGSAVDPVQARLTQLGSMQAKNLEELELQARANLPLCRQGDAARVAHRKSQDAFLTAGAGQQ